MLEGYIYPDKMAPEGPFGEWTGYYGALQPAEPVMTVEGMYWRNNPIMLGVPPNKPPAYDPYLYREYLRSAIMLRELRGTGIPGITDVQCFAEGGTRLFNAISIDQKYAGHSSQVLHAAASVASAGYFGRIVVVVDDDIDVTDMDDVLWAIFTRMDPERSVDILKRASLLTARSRQGGPETRCTTRGCSSMQRDLSNGRTSSRRRSVLTPRPRPRPVSDGGTSSQG